MQTNFSLGFSEEFYLMPIRPGDRFYVKKEKDKRIIGFSMLEPSSPQQKLIKKTEKVVHEIGCVGIVPLIETDLKGKSFRRDTFLSNLKSLFRAVKTPELIPEGSKLKLDPRHKQLLHEWAWDLVRADVGVDQSTPLSREECLELVQPDCVFEVEGKELPAHRSILSNYRYWAAQLNNGMRESLTGRFSGFNGLSAEELRTLLHWLYTGSLNWTATPQEGDDREQIKQALETNLAMLKKMEETADYYGLEALLKQCQTVSQALSLKKVDEMASLSSIVQFFQKGVPSCRRPPHFFSKPASTDQFYDLKFRMGHELILANRLLAVSHSHSIKKLCRKHPEAKEISLDGTALPAKFVKEWLGRVDVLPEADLTNENVLTFLKLAHQEKNDKLRIKCCVRMIGENLLSSLSDKEIPLVDHLGILDGTEIPPILADSRLKIRTLTSLKNLEGSELIMKWLERELIMKWLERDGPALKGLYLVGRVDDAFIDFLASHCPNLEKLMLQNAQLTNRSYLAFARHCSKLLHITFSYKIGDAAPIALSKGCQQLREVNLFDGTAPNSGLISFGKSCLQMRSLSLRYLEGLNYSILEATIPQFLQLQELNLSGTSDLEDAAMQNLLEKCPPLRKLYLGACGKIGDGTAKKIALYGLQLQDLSIEGTNISEMAIREILEECPQLRDLTIPTKLSCRQELRQKYPHVTIR